MTLAGMCGIMLTLYLVPVNGEQGIKGTTARVRVGGARTDTKQSALMPIVSPPHFLLGS